MKIVTVTLVGPAHAKLIPDMLTSVRWADDHLLVSWNMSEEERAIIEDEIAKGSEGALENCTLYRVVTERVDFADARNQALRIASNMFAGHVVLMIDSDERWLGESPDRDVFVRGEYWRVKVSDKLTVCAPMPRFFSPYGRGDFVGRVHEYFDPKGDEPGEHDIPGEIVSTPKNDGALWHKWNRDLPILLTSSREDPLNIRWKFYLGETYRGLAFLVRQAAFLEAEEGEQRNSVLQQARDLAAQGVLYYMSAAKIVNTAHDYDKAVTDWDREQAGFAAYRASVLSREHDRPLLESLDCIAIGVIACPWLAELPWHAAWIYFGLRQHQMAVYWARIAKATQALNGPRHGFQEVVALGNGPEEIEGFALKAQGNPLGDEILRGAGVL